MIKIFFLLVLLSVPALAVEGGGSSESPWTTWYRHGLIRGLLKLRSMREYLMTHNMIDPHLKYPANVTCGKDTLLTRTIDGTCNDQKQTMMGAAGMRLGRNVPLKDGVSVESEILVPDPRLISRELFTRKEFKPVPFLNMMAATWIQFMTHDWFAHGKNETNDPFFLPLEDNDPLNQKEMMVLRTRIDRSRTENDRVLPVTFQNQVTHWWDGSQLYGSDLATSDKLRTFSDGLMKVTDRGLLPIDEDGSELAGFKDNWWVGLSLMHNLFTLEHNAIAIELKKNYPGWSDQKLFDTARMVNAAVMAKIHTIEWTPAILPNRTLRAAMNSNWKGLLNPTGNVRWQGEIIDEHVLTGIVGGSTNHYEVPYAMTEEFVSVYRMHSLLPEQLEVLSFETGSVKEVLPLEKTRNENSAPIIAKHLLRDMFYSLGVSHPGQLVLGNHPKFLQELSLPIMGKVDLAAIDIIRDRERGVPRYNHFRRALNLKPIKTFEDLTNDAVVVAKLKMLYNDDVEKLDLLVGSLAEEFRPTNFGFGETAFQIFIIQASRRLHSDRFYTESYTPAVYSVVGLKWIDNVTMKKVLLRHMPELEKSLTTVTNAFSPWKKN